MLIRETPGTLSIHRNSPDFISYLLLPAYSRAVHRRRHLAGHASRPEPASCRVLPRAPTVRVVPPPNPLFPSSHRPRGAMFRSARRRGRPPEPRAMPLPRPAIPSPLRHPQTPRPWPIKGRTELPRARAQETRAAATMADLRRSSVEHPQSPSLSPNRAPERIPLDLLDLPKP